MRTNCKKSLFSSFFCSPPLRSCQHCDELLELLLVGDCGQLSTDPLDAGLKRRSKKEGNIGIDARRFAVLGIDDIECRRLFAGLFAGLFDGELLSEKESQFLELFLPP